jgi:hypothetical protein
MAWNPSPEVAVARDAAKRLGDAPMCVVFYVTNEGGFGYASYGKNRALCDEAGKLAKHLYKAAMAEEWEAT